MKLIGTTSFYGYVSKEPRALPWALWMEYVSRFPATVKNMLLGVTLVAYAESALTVSSITATA
jgi:hypothetical protein